MQPLPACNEAVLLAVDLVPFLATALARRVFWERVVRWPDVRLLAAIYTLVAHSVTIGYHGMLAQRRFRAHQVVQCALLIPGSMSVQGPAWNRQPSMSSITHKQIAPVISSETETVRIGCRRCERIPFPAPTSHLPFGSSIWSYLSLAAWMTKRLTSWLEQFETLSKKWLSATSAG